MDSRKWHDYQPLFHGFSCVYCGSAANTSDHTPPRCFLPSKLPQDVQLMTVPACATCNSSFQGDEIKAAVILATVSFTNEDRAAVAKGGWVHSALQRDRLLNKLIEQRLGSDGIFNADEMVLGIFSNVLKKIAVGLLFYEFGRIVPREEIKVIGLEHAHNFDPDAFAEAHRYPDGSWPEVTPSGRELERQVMAVCGIAPRHAGGWKVHIPNFFAYRFLKRSDGTLLCAMRLHEALTCVLECPWPSRAGPSRKGKPRPRQAR